MAQSTTLPAGKLEPGARLRVSIERPAALGRGIAHHEGLTLFVARGIPGETVRAEVERVHPHHALARVVEVEAPAPERIQPNCAHFSACGGCDWQHVGYEGQLEIKRTVFADQLTRIGRCDVPDSFAVEAAPASLEYRDRLEFAPAFSQGHWLPAFHALEGKEPIPITRCMLAPQAYTDLAAALLEGLAGAGALISPQGPPQGPGGDRPPLQRITIQGIEGEDGAPGLAVLLHVKAGARDKPRTLRRRYTEAVLHLLPGLRRDFPQLTAIALRVQAATGGRDRQRRSLDVLAGPEWLTKRIGNRRYLTAHTGFFQVHPVMAERLTAHVLAAVNGGIAGAHPTAPIFDLFGGAGLFSLPLAEAVAESEVESAPEAVVEAVAESVVQPVANPVANPAANLRRDIVCVDSERASLKAGEETARRAGWAGLDNCHFQRADLEWAGALEKLKARWGEPAAILCDPPRRGLSAALAEALREQGPPLLVYVSCDGGTFARDAARLAPAYEITSLQGFDLFPQTHHLEVVGVFRRKE